MVNRAPTDSTGPPRGVSRDAEARAANKAGLVRGEDLSAMLSLEMRVAPIVTQFQAGQSQAAPRTPDESPCFGGRIAVTTVSEKT